MVAGLRTDMRILLGIALLGLTGCAARQATCPTPGSLADEAGNVLLYANGMPVTDRMVDHALRDMPPAQLEALRQAGALEGLAEKLALGQELYRRALEAGLQDDPEVRYDLALAAREQLASAWIEHTLSERLTDDAVQAFYDENPDRFGAAQVKASHILVETAEEAEAVLARLEAGEDFVALAGELSTDPGSPGGSLGWFEHGRMVEPFADAAFAASVGETVGPVQTRFGYHVIRVEDRREAVPLAEVRDEVEAELRAGMVREVLDEVRGDLEFTSPEGQGAN